MGINPLLEESICCPYCGETFSILIDASEPEQEYVEDCQVCCQPILISLSLGDEDAGSSLQVRREND